eukprot:scaffold181667_cov17-Prasinocladus_malaysianus.AAC.1
MGQSRRFNPTDSLSLATYYLHKACVLSSDLARADPVDLIAWKDDIHSMHLKVESPREFYVCCNAMRNRMRVYAGTADY